MPATRVVIAGAAGRDFHNFNVVYRGREDVRVVAFTATQIPTIEGRVYPPELAGPGYPEGIPILSERELQSVVREQQADEVIFAYSDVTHEHVLHVASRALAAGTSFRLLAPAVTMLVSSLPVVAVCAVRTGAGGSQTTRYVARLLREDGRRVAVLRPPLPHGELTRRAVQRFARFEDLDAADCTIEEREKYEPHLAEGNLVFAGIDYEAILRRAEQEADVILWDGGHDTPFVRPSMHLVVVDPHHPGDELRYHPGETNLRMADVCVVSKVDSAEQAGIDAVLASIAAHNPEARVVLAASPIVVEGDPAQIRGKRVLAVEDGPTLMHGEIAYGAAVLAARTHGAASLVDPRPFAVGSIAETLSAHRHVTELLPAMGYGRSQLEELRETISRSDAELVLIGTPIDLRRVIELDRPVLRVGYGLEEVGGPALAELLAEYGVADSSALV